MKSEVESQDVVLCWNDLLLKLCGAPTFSRDKVPELASKMEEIGIRIEPDLISRRRVLNDYDHVVLFAAVPGANTDQGSAAYVSAALTIDLASTVALADGEASGPEIELLMTQIDAWQELSESSRKRLKATSTVANCATSTACQLKGKTRYFVL